MHEKKIFGLGLLTGVVFYNACLFTFCPNSIGQKNRIKKEYVENGKDCQYIIGETSTTFQLEGNKDSIEFQPLIEYPKTHQFFLK